MRSVPGSTSSFEFSVQFTGSDPSRPLIAAFDVLTIAGSAIDVYDAEPLALDHPFRKLDNIVITPHLGYVTAGNYKNFYGQMVEDIRAWPDGKPVRVIAAK